MLGQTKEKKKQAEQSMTSSAGPVHAYVYAAMDEEEEHT